MAREIYFSTLDFLIKAIEAKEIEVEEAGGVGSRPRLDAQMTHLQRRLHAEFRYLAAIADGGNQPT